MQFTLTIELINGLDEEVVMKGPLELDCNGFVYRPFAEHRLRVGSWQVRETPSPTVEAVTIAL